MKKKKLKKLSLNKSIISDLDGVKGGLEANVGTRVGSGCPECKSVRKYECATYTCDCFTLNGGTLCTFVYCPTP